MFLRRITQVSSLRFLGVGFNSCLLRPRRVSSPSNLLFSMKIATSTPNRPTTSTPNRPNSCQRSNTFDPASLMADLDSEIFNYTTGRFLANEAYRLAQRRRVFDVPGLFKIIANATNCNTEQITGFRKFGEGGLNRIFLVTLDTGFQLIARIPYPLLSAKAYAIASEVATMDLLRSKGIPTPKIYAYSFTSDNEAQTEYILMEYVKGTDLSRIWSHLERDEIKALVDQLVKFESVMMSIPFPAGGSVYYSKDLMELSGNKGILLEDKQDESGVLKGGRFCMGPDLSVPLWYGRREQLEVFRGPYQNAESVLTTGAEKELAYLDKFGTPRVPYQHLRREHYNYEKQSPLDHAKNLHRYLRLAPCLVPNDRTLSTFCIRHPDLTENNIRISMESDRLEIVSILDWQNTAVLPLFLLAGTPHFIQNEALQQIVPPELPDNFETLSEDNKDWEKDLLRRRLVHYHYHMSTGAYNKIHQKGLVDPLNPFRRRIFMHASAMWEGETIKLLRAMIELVHDWEAFATDGTACTVDFPEEEIEKAKKLSEALVNTERNERQMMACVGCADETWVPVAGYEEAKAWAQELKRMTLDPSAEDDEESTEDDLSLLEANWPLDDMEEHELKEYE